MAGLPEQFRLEEIALPRILLDLYRKAFSGTVTLSRDKIGKRFRFQEGVPIFSESTLASESLGVQLMDSGALSRVDYAKVVHYVERNGCKEGKALLALKLINAKGLFLALKEQIRLRLIECFSWTYGEFIIDSREVPPEGAQHFRTDVYQLLQRGLEAHWGADRVLADLVPHMSLYPSPTEGMAKLRERLLSDDSVDALFDAMDGSTTLFRAVQLANTHRALATAWILDASGALRFSHSPANADSTETKPESIAFDEPEIEIVCAGVPLNHATGPEEFKKNTAASAHTSSDNERRQRLSDEIESRFALLGNVNHYQCLGVEPDADPSAVKRVYLLCARQYHPDALARSGVDEEVRRHATAVFAEIGVAYGILSNASKRADYDASLESTDPGVDVEALTQAEILFRKGQILLQAGNFLGAIEYLQPAVDIWPEEAAYQGALGWCLYKKRPSEPERGLEHLEHAAQLDSADGVIQFRTSVVLRSLGEIDRAAKILENAKNIDPGS